MKNLLILLVFFFIPLFAIAQKSKHVLAFYTAKNDLAHISFVNEALPWFGKQAEMNGFDFEATQDWVRLNSEELKTIDLVVFLDTRPKNENQRLAFENYMKNGGAWMGFHFSAFALTPSDFPQNWDWYHEEFLGSGQYANNTWRPTSAILKVENPNHPIFNEIPNTFQASPNEWYNWEHDLRNNPEIEILASIDPVSFPLGTGPKPHEIWHEGYYPTVWTNKNYHMVYFNMGHNDMDYDGGTNETLSHTFGNKIQDQLVINTLLWLLNKKLP